jgi:hypothetical protein
MSTIKVQETSSQTVPVVKDSRSLEVHIPSARKCAKYTNIVVNGETHTLATSTNISGLWKVSPCACSEYTMWKNSHPNLGERVEYKGLWKAMNPEAGKGNEMISGSSMNNKFQCALRVKERCAEMGIPY